MPLAGMFVPVILFHNHMILFSDSPLFSLPSFLHDSLTMRFRIFPVPLYLVMFVSCPSDIVPHPSATPEVSYFIYMILRPISYWLCTCSYHIYRWIYQMLYHIRVWHLSYHIYRFRHTHFASRSQVHPNIPCPKIQEVNSCIKEYILNPLLSFAEHYLPLFICALLVPKYVLAWSIRQVFYRYGRVSSSWV